MTDPTNTRDKDERRLTGLKAGAVGLTVAGLGVFAGLAAAGTDDGPAVTPPAPAASPAGQSAADAARIAEDGSFFDDQAQPGAVRAYDDGASGDDREHDGGEHRRGGGGHHHGHHAAPPDAGYGGYGGYDDRMPEQGSGYGAPQGGQGSYAPSQGSTGGS